MKSQYEQLDYNDFEAIVQRARMERSVAVGDAIAGLFALIHKAGARLIRAIKSGVSGSRVGTLDIPAHH